MATWNLVNADVPRLAKTAIGITAVYVEDYRDGALSDVQIIGAAFTAVAAGGEVRFGAGVTYEVDSAISVDLSAKPDVLVNGQGATLHIADGLALTGFHLGGVLVDTTTLTAAVVAGDAQLTVDDIGDAQAGDIVRIASDGEVFNSERPVGTAGRLKQEMARIKSVSAGTLVLEGFPWDTYSITGYTVTVTIIRPVKNLTVENLNVLGGSGSTSQTVGLRINYFDGAEIVNCAVAEIYGGGFRFSYGMDGTATRCRGTDCDSGASAGNALLFEAVFGGKAIGFYGARNFQALDSQMSRDLSFIGCTIEDGSAAGLATHGSDTFKIIDNTIRNCGGGIIVRGTNNIITGNHIYGAPAATFGGWHGIVVGQVNGDPTYVGLSGTNLVIENNYIDISGPTYWGSSDVGGIRIYSPLVDARITGNTLKGFNGTGIRTTGDYNTRVLIADNTIDCTDQYQTTYPYWGIALKATNTLSTCINTDITIDRNTIIGPVNDGAIHVEGGPTTSPRSDNINIRWNTIDTCGEIPIDLSDGYFGSNAAIYGNETLDEKAVELTVANWTVPPYIGAHGYGRTPRPLGVGQEMGARMRPGLYYGPIVAGTSNVALTLDRLTVVPISIPRQVTLNRIGINITAGATGGSEGRLGIYADLDDGYGGAPGALVAGSDVSVATDAIAFVQGTIACTLNPGLYWLAFVSQTSAPSVTAVTGMVPAIGYEFTASMAGRNGYYKASVSGALPDPFGSLSTISSTVAFVQIGLAASSTL